MRYLNEGNQILIAQQVDTKESVTRGQVIKFDNDNMMAKFKETSQRERKERKPLKVYVSGKSLQAF